MFFYKAVISFDDTIMATPVNVNVTSFKKKNTHLVPVHSIVPANQIRVCNCEIFVSITQ